MIFYKPGLNKSIYGLFLLIILVISSFSCSTVKEDDDCITEGYKDITVRWGEVDNETGSFAAYQMNGNLEVKRVIRDSAGKPESVCNFGNIDKQRFCSLYLLLNNAMIKTQVLNEPGKITRFFEYKNPFNQTVYRAQWIDKFQTKNSILFREVYDSLQVSMDSIK